MEAPFQEVLFFVEWFTCGEKGQLALVRRWVSSSFSTRARAIEASTDARHFMFLSYTVGVGWPVFSAFFVVGVLHSSPIGKLALSCR